MFINQAKKTIEMNADEYNAAMTFGTDEYKALREIHQDYPDYKTVVVEKNQKKKGKDHLTMDFIKDYVRVHGSPEQKAEFELIAFPHYTEDGDIIEAQSFFEITKWFKAQFPDYNKGKESKTRKEHDDAVEAIFKAVDDKIAAAKEEAAKAKREKLEAEAAEFRKAS